MRQIATRKGTPLTKHERKCLQSLKRLAAKWESEPNRLWLFSASGHLHVMMHEDEETNPVPEYGGEGYAEGGVNQDNIVCEIEGIDNDGGDW